MHRINKIKSDDQVHVFCIFTFVHVDLFGSLAPVWDPRCLNTKILVPVWSPIFTIFDFMNLYLCPHGRGTPGGYPGVGTQIALLLTPVWCPHHA